MKEYTINDFVREECERDPAFRAAWEEEAPARALAMSISNSEEYAVLIGRW